MADDVSPIVLALHHSLLPEQAARLSAERALADLERNAQMPYLVLLFRVVVDTSIDVDGAVRQAGAIALKNLVARRWDASARDTPLPEPEKAVVRANLLEGLVHAPPAVRVQLGLIFKSVGYSDFPHAWPGLIDALTSNLQAGEQRTLGALYALRMLVKKCAARAHRLLSPPRGRMSQGRGHPSPAAPHTTLLPARAPERRVPAGTSTRRASSASRSVPSCAPPSRSCSSSSRRRATRTTPMRMTCSASFVKSFGRRSRCAAATGAQGGALRGSAGRASFRSAASRCWLGRGTSPLPLRGASREGHQARGARTAGRATCGVPFTGCVDTALHHAGGCTHSGKGDVRGAGRTGACG